MFINIYENKKEVIIISKNYTKYCSFYWT